MLQLTTDTLDYIACDTGNVTFKDECFSIDVFLPVSSEMSSEMFSFVAIELFSVAAISRSLSLLPVEVDLLRL